MKTYNKKSLESNKRVIQSTRKFSKDLITKSMKIVNKLTHPNQKIAFIGSVIGGIIGVVLVLFSAVGYISGRSLWAGGLLVAGVITLTSNIINIKRIK